MVKKQKLFAKESMEISLTGILNMFAIWMVLSTVLGEGKHIKRRKGKTMNEIETKKDAIGDLLWELWDSLPEPKWAYPYYKQKVFISINNWYPPKVKEEPER